VQRRRALRWLVPVGVLCVAVLAASGVFDAGANSDSLPRTTPAALLAAVRDTNVEGFSGTVVTHVALGLPELPNVGPLGESADDTSLSSLLSGSHTLQVWYGGTDKQRIALLGPTEETDVFRNGRDVWQWSSADRTAVHVRLPQPVDRADELAGLAETLTPAELARRAIAAVNPSTRVTVRNGESVADRSAYELILTPRTGDTKVGSVHIAVDGSTKVPLGVQVYPKSSAAPAIDVAFTDIRFGAQSERNFEFTPPPDAKVRQPAGSGPESTQPDTRQPPIVTGSGWTTVVALAPDKAAVSHLGNGVLERAATPVSGAWGRGRLFDGNLVTVLITNDGRVYAGTVDAAMLYAAAAR
jgi:outer membrane lipoprotein-sorting protein